MKIILFITFVVIVVIFIFKKFDPDKISEDTSRPSDVNKPSQLIENDKVICISDVDRKDLHQALISFCNLYNKKSYVALPRLWQLTSNSFAITFPYDVDFATYCFAVNFLKYPINIQWKANVRAWATTKQGDDWIADKAINKLVMIYLADGDKEYDSVFMTTKDNIGYKLSFATNKEELLPNVKEIYVNPTTNIKDLTGSTFEDFK